MKVQFEKVSSKEQEGAFIRAISKTEDIRSAIDLLEGGSSNIAVSKEGKTYLCKISAIYYIESVDKRSFLYTKDDCFETKYRLYELEEMLPHHFFRCSKAMIINLKKVKSVKSSLGSRMNAIMLNEEMIVISRSYVKELKRRLEI